MPDGEGNCQVRITCISPSIFVGKPVHVEFPFEAVVLR